MYCVLVSAENLEKSLKHMEKQLQQLEKDLQTFPVAEDKHDKFVAKMSISFGVFFRKTHTNRLTAITQTLNFFIWLQSVAYISKKKKSFLITAKYTNSLINGVICSEWNWGKMLLGLTLCVGGCLTG